MPKFYSSAHLFYCYPFNTIILKKYVYRTESVLQEENKLYKGSLVYRSSIIKRGKAAGSFSSSFAFEESVLLRTVIFSKLSRKLNRHTKFGELRKIAKNIKTDHELAFELWSTEEYMPRLLAILIMDKKLLSQDVLDKLDTDMQMHTEKEGNN